MTDIYQVLMVLSSELLANIFFSKFNNFDVEMIEHARLAVKELTKDSNDFWQVSFSDANKHTVTCLFISQNKTINSALLEEINLKNKETKSDDNYWLIKTTIAYISSLDEVTDDLIEKAKHSEKFMQYDDEWIEKSWLNSKCPWDEYLKSLTPDQPTYLVDFALTSFHWMDEVQIFLLSLAKYFSRKEIDDARRLMENVACDQIGYKVNLV